MEIIATIETNNVGEDISAKIEDFSTEFEFVKIKNISLESFGIENLERMLNCKLASVDFVCDCPSLFNIKLHKSIVRIKIL